MGASGVLDIVIRYWTAQNLKTKQRWGGSFWSWMKPSWSILEPPVLWRHRKCGTRASRGADGVGISHWKSQFNYYKSSTQVERAWYLALKITGEAHNAWKITGHSILSLPLPRATRGQEESWMLPTMLPILSKSSLHSKFSQTHSQASRLTVTPWVWILEWLILFGCRFYFSTSRSRPQLVNSGWFCPRFGG